MPLRRILCSMSLAACLAAALPAQAQGTMMFLNKSPGGRFTNDDWTLLTSTATELLDHGKAGEMRAWSNPATGNSGQITLGADSQHRGAPCRKLSFVNRAKNYANPARSAHIVCKADAGWKILK